MISTIGTTADNGRAFDIVAHGTSNAGGQGFDVLLHRSGSGETGTFTDSDGGSATVSSWLPLAKLDLSGFEGSGANVHTDNGLTLTSITGSAGADVIDVAATIVNAGDGDDIVYGVDQTGSAYTVLDGGLGHDRLYGGSGFTEYVIDSRYDRIIQDHFGGRVDAALTYILPKEIEDLQLTGTRNIDGTGNDHANQIEGNSGHNVLSGLGGDDVLIGGLGQDVLTGGAGGDCFQFNSVADFASAKGDRCDVITDFSSGDQIDMYLPWAARTVDGKYDVHFLGEGAFTGGGAEVRYFTHGGDTFIQGDVNGDKIVDFELRLTGVHALTAADFSF